MSQQDILFEYFNLYGGVSMKSNEFLNELKAHLSSIPDDEQNIIIEYFSEIISDKIDDGQNEEQIISELGSPESIAKTIIQDYQENNVQPEKSNKRFEQIEKEYEACNIKSIKVDINNSTVILKQNNNDNIKITYFTNKYCPKKIENIDGNITLEKDLTSQKSIMKQIIGNFLIWTIHDPKTIIEIPRKCTNLKLDIHTNNAKALVDNITAKNLNVKTSNGKIHISNLNSNEVLLHTSNGGISADNTAVKSFNAKTSNGRIDLIDVNSPNKLHIKTSNGAISIKNILSDDISLVTSNGKIDGNIIGEINNYNISSKTSNGNNSLKVYNNQNPNPNKNLLAHTSNGDIAVIFTK